LEECYEALEAIDQGDSKKLSEELGDLLMQIVLHAQIAAEQDKFDIRNVLQGINAKLIHRHPHVFGKTKAKDAQEVVLSWEALKQEEREEASLLSSLPKGMPPWLIVRQCSGALLGSALIGGSSRVLWRRWWRRLRS